MSKILDIIKEKAVKPEINKNRPATIGKIIEYYKNANRADVMCNGINGGKNITLTYIPVLINNINILSRNLKPGDNVLITFISEDSGIITGIISDDALHYTNKACNTKDSGGNIPDYFCSR